jgi:hypothetical protein
LTARQQKTDAEIHAAVSAFGAGEKLLDIAARLRISPNTVLRYARAAGVRSPNRPGPRPKVTAPAIAGAKQRPCGCKRGCGLFFSVTRTTRSRRYHPECPKLPEMKAEMAAVHAARKAAKNGPPRGKAPTLDPTKAVSWCGACAGLPARRPKSGCPECRLPFRPDTITEAEAFVIRRSGICT